MLSLPRHDSTVTFTSIMTSLICVSYLSKSTCDVFFSAINFNVFIVITDCDLKFFTF